MMSEEMKKISNFKISCMNRGFASCLLCVLPGLSLTAQSYLQDYRSAVKGYNQDIRSAAFAVTAREEMVKSAKSDFLPSVSGAANYQFAGNPSELSLTLPNNESLAFQGSHSRYGMLLSILSADCIKSIQNYFNGKALVTVKPPYDGQIQISRDRITSLKMWLNS